MDEAVALLRRLQDEGVQLWVHDGRLRIRSDRPLDDSRRDALRRAKPDIVDLLTAEPVTRDTPMRDVERPDPLPLTEGQEGLWLLDRLGPDGGEYDERSVLRIRGALDVAALRWALDRVVARHEVFRTRYPSVDGAPVQVVGTRGPSLEVEDLGPVPPAERDERLHRWLAERAERGFDLAAAPPVAVTLVRLGDDDHALVVDAHHIMIDGSSFGLLHRELDELYTARVAGLSDTRPELPAQYGDYAAWQRRATTGEVQDRLLRYWRARLAGAPQVLDLPLDRPRPAEPTRAGEIVHLPIGDELAASLRELARAENVTLFTVLLAGLHAVLARWTGQKDVCIGLPVDVRAHRDADAMIGYFLNTVVHRADMTDAPTFRELLARVHAGTAEAYDHRELPFERLVADATTERAAGVNPLFQVMFTHLGDEASSLGDLDVTPVEPAARTAKFDLTFFASPGADGSGFDAGFEFSSDVFDRGSVERVAGWLGVLLGVVSSDCGVGVWDVDLLVGGEWDRVVREWNATGCGVSWGVLPDVFRERVRLCPDAVAVEFGGECVSYGVLDGWVNRLAAWLRDCGVGPESVVGVSLPRSVELVVALFAVHRAGGAYLPLDRDYPAERVEFMVSDAAPVVVVDDVDVVRGFARGVAVADVRVPVSVDNAAYVIYTSGSTGRPKGVVVSHGAVANRVAWMQGEFGVVPGERVLQKTPSSFDVSVWEFFWPLSVGATLVVARPDGHRDPRYLLDVLGGVDTAHFVPSMLSVFLDEVEASGRVPAGLRRVFCSGEALSGELAARCHRLLGVELFNLYGPTEAAVEVTWIRVAPDTVPESGGVPIGVPAWNTQVFVLDEVGRPVPVGVAGELYLGGVQLARGYRGRPDLTAERFVPSPFGAGERLYRTGDLARWRADGLVEYLGRVDDQVKVRGVRVELGEIEAVLAEHPDVAAGVVATTDHGGGTRLVAYVVPEPSVASGAAEDGLPAELTASVRAHLRRRLPDAMVPSAYVGIEAVPLSPSGKCDRRALPAAARELRSAGPRVPPRSRTESVVHGIWLDILGVDAGVDDNLFDVGGHSLLVMQMARRITDELEIEIRPRHMFELPTIAEIAGFADTRCAGKL